MLLREKKEEGLEDLSNWKPITISSVFLRLINRIWAKRLEGTKRFQAYGRSARQYTNPQHNNWQAPQKNPSLFANFPRLPESV